MSLTWKPTSFLGPLLFLCCPCPDAGVLSLELRLFPHQRRLWQAPVTLWKRVSLENETHWKRLWCWERLKVVEKRTTEGEMAGWCHSSVDINLGQTLGDGKGQEIRACCHPWGLKDSDTTRQLHNRRERPFSHPHQSLNLSDSKFLLVCRSFNRNCPEEIAYTNSLLS